MYLSWERAIELFSIGKIYHEASLVNLPEKIKNFFYEWIEAPKGRSLYLSGSPGSGKTYASICLLKSLIDKRKYSWIIYVRSDELDNELLKACDERAESYVLEKYHEVPFLFIDDLGVERVNDRIIKQYYSIIDRRLNNLMPTVFTSNISRKDIEKNLGDRIASRLQMTTEIIFPKKDYRKGL
jgi:DNA replication protein DnaC